MKERPIPFSAPMVRALLDGTKTQTRHALREQPPHHATELCSFYSPTRDGLAWYIWNEAEQYLEGDWLAHCPYGQPGDRLWVREKCIAEGIPDGLYGVRYLADDAFIPIQSTSEAADRWLDLRFYGKRPSPVATVKTVPAIHMPRWASRITLEVIGVRVERLQEISVADALAEGVNVHPDHHGKPRTSFYSPVQAYRDLWGAINGPGSWGANPWVWVVEFRRAEGGAA